LQKAQSIQTLLANQDLGIININFDYVFAQTVTEGIQHQTVPEMLTDKLTAIMVGQPPTDTTRWAWCDNGKLGAGSAPDGRWDVGGGRVHVSLSDVDDSDDVLGSRSPVG
jgi:hypothetical protein